MAQAHIVLVDDEQSIIDPLEYALEKEGFKITCFNDGNHVVDYLVKHKVDMILLDIKMPEMDGLETLKVIRKFSEVPVLFLTSKTEEIDRILGLELGADDYICKPFSIREVVARIKAILRRSTTHKEVAKEPTNSKELLKLGTIELHPLKHQIFFKGFEIKLTAGEFVILQTFLENPGIVLTRDRFLAKMNKDDQFLTDRIIDTHIKKIRKKFNEIDPEINPIETVHGLGYKLREQF